VSPEVDFVEASQHSILQLPPVLQREEQLSYPGYQTTRGSLVER
jgi:hypothetical protein